MSDAEPSHGIFKRLLLGSLIVIVATASATAVAAFRELDKVGDYFRESTGLNLGAGDLAEADTGEPQTIMIIGSDRRDPNSRDVRSGAGGGARSDTVILVRLDPDRRATALLSLPRDLRVRIPGHGTDKLNAAFAIGGARLTLRTVKAFTGLRINHVINVDFGGFREAVNEIGCVYVDIDRRYFNDNSGPGPDYATIDVPAGYQRLCGQSALDWVRYRHTDSDLVRAARQQEFLRQAKEQVGIGELIGDRDRLLEIFSEYTSTDIRSNRAIARLLNLAIAAADYPIREVHFRGEVTSGNERTNTPSYVVARRGIVRQITREFLGVRDTRGPRAGSVRKERRGRRSSSLVAVGGQGKNQALAALAAGVRIPIFYPTRVVGRSTFAEEPRVYAIRDPDGRVHNSYRMVVKRNLIGEFYGIQGTSWMDPPILRNPSEKRRLGGREYELHYDGDRLRLVAWRTRDAVYWVSNTLLQSLSERQMLDIARSARLLG